MSSFPFLIKHTKSQLDGSAHSVFISILTLVLLTGLSQFCSAQITLRWDPPVTGPEPEGYRVYYGYASQNYIDYIDVGTSASYTFTGLDYNEDYYFATTSFAAEKESLFSNEVSWPNDNKFANGPFGDADNWSPRTPELWHVVKDPASGSRAYFLNNSTKSLHEISIYEGETYTDFILTLRARTAEPSSTDWRDFYIVFGCQDMSNYYAVSFNCTDNDLTNGILKIENGEITEVSQHGAVPQITDEDYHIYQIIRSGSSITVKKDWITVYTASDSTYTSGKVGIGSLNDSAYFDDINIAAKQTLTISSSDGGSIITPGAGQFLYNTGDIVGIVAQTDEGCEFVNWTGSGVDAGKVSSPLSAVTSIEVDDNYSIRANFAATSPISGLKLFMRHTNGDISYWKLGPDGSRESGDRIGTVSDVWEIGAIGDINGDGTSDILWRHDSGDIAYWTLNPDGSRNSGGNSGSLSTEWEMKGAGDINTDGADDIIWRHSTGDMAYWVLDSDGKMASGGSMGSISTDWFLVARGDIDGDGVVDFIWQHSSGYIAFWLLNTDGSQKAVDMIGRVSTEWTVCALGDIDRDGHDDIIWRHTSGENAYWFLNEDGTLKSGGSMPYASPSWTLSAVGDIDGDGTVDIIWRHTSGEITFWLLDAQAKIKSGGTIGTISSEWTICGSGR